MLQIIFLLKTISLIAWAVFLVLSLIEGMRVYRYFSRELKNRKVLKSEFDSKAKKLYLYSLAFFIAIASYSFLNTL